MTTILKNPKFDDIRPYYEDEIPDAMQRIANSPSFPIIASYVYPGEPIEQVRQRIASYRTVRDFQTETMSMMNKRVIEQSISEFSCSGIERLDRNASYLYVSNHRDIVLDSSLLQYFLDLSGFDTTEITFGANCLLSWDILIMDTDFHSVFDNHGKLINSPKPIHIGNNVWIGCRNTILKGVSIANNVVISANSTITRCVEESNCIVGGHGKSTEIIKREISWSAADSRGEDYLT